MRELIIIATDWYAPDGAAAHGSTAAQGSAAAHAARPRADAPELPGLDQLARFGRVRPLAEGWRAFLARRLGSEVLACAAPAAVADSPVNVAQAPPTERFGSVWFATALALVPGLSDVRLGAQGVLRLPPPVQQRLAADFSGLFAAAGWQLAPLPAGEFLLYGPRLHGAVRTTEPARCLGGSLAAHLPQAPHDPALRRLTAEIEMWLHAHEINMIRTREPHPPVSTLWLWGGGERLDQARTGEGRREVGAAFSEDAYVRGLWARLGATCAAVPQEFGGVLPVLSRRAPTLLADAVWLGAARATDTREGLARFDARWVLPAVRGLARGALDQLLVIANDRALALRSRDRLRRWRRARSALEVLE